MNVAQKCSYWSRWQRCAAILTARGLTREQIEAKRRTVTEKALGYAKSMSDWKRWKNAEVDQVFAAFAAIYDDANLDAQLDAIDQPKSRYLRVLDECRALVATLKDQHPDSPDYSYVVDNYLNALTKRICYKAADLCTDAQLQRVKGVLNQQIAREEKAIQREEAKATVDDGSPF